MSTRVGIAFQGGGFPAGAIGAGVVKRLVEKQAFSKYDIVAFSGTSAGAMVACVCWGCMLKGNNAILDAPKILRDQWMYFALGVVPNAEVAQMVQLIDSLARKNPLYEYCAENVLVRVLRSLMEGWIHKYIPIDELTRLMQQAKANNQSVPSLRLGAANILTGDTKVFTEDDFCLEAILASGSLDEVNGITEIKAGANAGFYLDGAWGTNPPLKALLECELDEIWIVEVFPKKRNKIPQTPGERKDRKDELWQNSLVEQEKAWIEKVNQWLASGELKPNGPKTYRQIAVKKMVGPDLPAGAAFVNSPSFIEQMIQHGYDNADVFLR